MVAQVLVLQTQVVLVVGREAISQLQQVALVIHLQLHLLRGTMVVQTMVLHHTALVEVVEQGQSEEALVQDFLVLVELVLIRFQHGHLQLPLALAVIMLVVAEAVVMTLLQEVLVVQVVAEMEALQQMVQRELLTQVAAAVVLEKVEVQLLAVLVVQALSL
jgi:hypothetical protein